MAGRPRRPNKDELKERYNPDVAAPSKRSTTMGLDRALAARIREIAHVHRVSAVDILNGLVEYALEHASFEVERERLKVDLKKKPPGDSKKPPRDS